MQPTFATAFDARRNALNALRLFFAAAVVVSHTWPLGGWGMDPVLGDVDLGHWAVAGFFVISGYLITASRMAEPSTRRYLARRVLRIYPGYWVCLAVVALVVAPVAWVHGGHPLGSYVTLRGPVAYLVGNVTLVRTRWGIAGTPAGVPFPGDWNGSLWSLPFEFACYLIVGAIGAVGALRGRRLPVVGAAACFLVLNAANHVLRPGHEAGYASLLLQCGALFFSGALVWAFADRLPVTGWAAAVAAGWLVAAAATGTSLELGGPPLAYLCLWLGCRLPDPLTRVGRRHDLSYGVYLYAFPLQQLLASFGVRRWGLPVFLALSLAGALTLGLCSYVLVERPALRWKERLRSGARRAAAPLEGDPEPLVATGDAP
jgi:peptidoglycan/LPS O-acetylase OafA/YrhL